MSPWESAGGSRDTLLGSHPIPCHVRRCSVKGRLNQQSHHFLYSGGEFVRLYPVNSTPTRNYALKTKRQLRVRYKSALDIWGLLSVPHSRLKFPKMSTKSWHGL